MNVLHIANLTDDKTKGPNTNVPQNVLYGNEMANVGLYNLCDSKLAKKIPNEKYFCVKEYKHVKELPGSFCKPDIVIFHGVYFIKYCQIARWLKKHCVPYIIVPRCSMTKAAINSHALKKKIANKIFFNKFIAGASSVQFLTKNEYLESKNNFIFRNYYVLGNGIEMPRNFYTVKKRNDFKIVFVGRYNVYHKGLDVLLKSVKEHVDWFRKNNVTVELYGSDSDNGLEFLRKYIDGYSLEDLIHIRGAVFGEAKEKALIDADVFIHTSRLEGQPTSVIEAISYGVPVIVTPGTNVSDIVEKYGLGFVTKLDSEAVFDCIVSAFLRKEDYNNISKNEIKYAKDNFSWCKIMKEAIDYYSRTIAL